jgi:PD-(D/E)XK nuclease superfamily
MPFDQEQEAILNRFTTNNLDLEALEAKISRFNIFEAVGMVRQEIKHSNFIQFLLNPVEKHRLNDLFLKELLTEVLRVAKDDYLGSLNPAAMEFTDADIRREWRHIDLLAHSPRNNFVCAIENKVDSTEGFNQLKTYQSVIDCEFPHCEKLLIYLTKEGDKASCSDWLSLSYGGIADIIEKSAKNTNLLSAQTSKFRCATTLI